MSLSVENAAVSWVLPPQAPTAAQQAGACGPAQALASSLVVSNVGASWGLVPLVPSTAQIDATQGPTQAYTSSLVVVGAPASWSIPTLQIAQPRVAAQRGAGGPTQENATRLFVVAAQTSWTLEAQTMRARFDYATAPDGFSVLFTSRTGDAPDLLSWDFGDGESGAGSMPSHIYATVGAFTVELTAHRTRGFERTPLCSIALRLIQISSLAEPDESLEEVLNLEVGHHAYEPVRVAAGDVGENVSHFNEVVNLPPGQLQTLLFYTPARTIRVRQVTATGTGDGLFRLLLNGQVVDAKRSYATQRNVRFDIEEGLKLTPEDTLEVRVINSSALSQSYEGALLGRTTG